MEQTSQKGLIKGISKHISNIFKNERNVLISLMLFGLLCRLYNLTAPLLDRHSWRQTDTAAIARNFYYDGYNIFYPQIDWGGAGPGYVESEFQLVPFIIALFYKLFGVHEYVARLVIIAFSIGSIYLLYKMVRIYYSKRVAIFSTIFFIISPMELFFGRAVMPDSAMIFFSIGSLYFFNKWTNDEKNSSFILATICTSLAFLVKISTLYLGLPLLWLAYAKYGKKILFTPKLYIFVILALIPAFSWYYFAHSVLAQYNTLDFWTLGSGTKFAGLGTFIDLVNYTNIFKILITDIFTPIGLLLFVYGLYLRKIPEDYVFYFWTLAVAIFFLLLLSSIYENDYYLRALIPAVAVFVGKALSDVYEQKKIVSYVFVGLMVILSVNTMPFLYQQDNAAFEAGTTVDKITGKGDLIITTPLVGSSPSILYYSNRKGWVLREDKWSEKAIEQMKVQGAKFLVIAPQTLLFNNSQFANHLFSNYWSIIGNNFVVFDLSLPSDISHLPNQNDLDFKGSGVLVGGNIKEAVSDLMSITCYYNRSNIGIATNNINERYYGLVIEFIDGNNQILKKDVFITSELPSNGTVRNNYVTSLSSDEKAKIRDVQVRIEGTGFFD